MRAAAPPCRRRPSVGAHAARCLSAASSRGRRGSGPGGAPPPNGPGQTHGPGRHQPPSSFLPSLCAPRAAAAMPLFSGEPGGRGGGAARPRAVPMGAAGLPRVRAEAEPPLRGSSGFRVEGLVGWGPPSLLVGKVGREGCAVTACPAAPKRESWPGQRLGARPRKWEEAGVW